MTLGSINMSKKNEQMILAGGFDVKDYSMSPEDAAMAKLLFKEWFERYPNIENPTDINKKEKHEYMAEIGWKQFQLMQRARKTNTKVYGYPFPWTKKDYWKKNAQKKLSVVG